MLRDFKVFNIKASLKALKPHPWNFSCQTLVGTFNARRASNDTFYLSYWRETFCKFIQPFSWEFPFKLRSCSMTATSFSLTFVSLRNKVFVLEDDEAKRQDKVKSLICCLSAWLFLLTSQLFLFSIVNLMNIWKFSLACLMMMMIRREARWKCLPFRKLCGGNCSENWAPTVSLHRSSHENGKI
jgi:hypothetical protein